MDKPVRKRVKTEKRILKLMYKKGVFEVLDINLDNIGWESEMRIIKKGRTRNGIKRQWRRFVYTPEMRHFLQDYWGDGDSQSVIKAFIDFSYFNNGMGINEETGWPLGKPLTLKELIPHLKAMKTVRCDSKFNKFLKAGYDE